jgi:hypothetical protein
VLARGCVGSVLVLLGGLVVSTLPASTPVLRWDGFGDALQLLRGHELTRVLALAVVLVGLAALASAWLRLCRWAAHAGPEAGALEEVRWATIVWCAPLVLAPPLFSRDGWSYAAQGMLAHLGISPYTHGPSALTGPVVEAVDPMWLHTPTPYGPLPMMFGDVFAAQTGNPWILVIGHRATALLGLGLLAWAAPRLATWCGANPALASALVIASPLMIANGVAGLHNDLLMVGLMACALVVAAEHGWWWGAALGGAAAAVKVPGGLVCIAVALVTLPLAATLRERVRRLAAVALVSGGVLLGLGVVSGLGHGWVEGLTVPGVINTPLSLTTVLGQLLDQAASVLGLDTGPDALRDLVRTLGSALAVLVALVVALRWRTGDRRAAVTATACVAAAMVLTSPVVHLWYLLWLVPFLAVQSLERRAGAAVVTVSIVAGLTAPLDSSLRGAYLAIAMGSIFVAAVLPVLLLTPGARERVLRIVGGPRVREMGRRALS